MATTRRSASTATRSKSGATRSSSWVTITAVSPCSARSSAISATKGLRAKRVQPGGGFVQK